MTKVLIAAAGTGGHLFPALYLAQAFQAEDPNCEIRFVGVGRQLEAKILDGAGFKRSTLRIQGVKGSSVLGILRWLLDLPKPVVDCWRIFSDFKPDIVVGVGGYVTVIPVIMARLTGIKSWIHEAEAQLGLANKLLIWFANQLSVAYPDTNVIFPSKTRYTGHPLRPQLKQERFLSKRRERTRVLVLGGSQGATALDRGMQELASKLQGMGVREVLHQTRPENRSSVVEAYSAQGFTICETDIPEESLSGATINGAGSAVDGVNQQKISARVVSFLDRIEEAYAWADIIISRTGAGTTRELLIVNRPTICVPYPHGHEQLDNAKILKKKGIGIIVEECGESKMPSANTMQAKSSSSVTGDFADRLGVALELALDPIRFSVPLEPERSVDESAAKVIAQGCLELVKK